jgi:hypothetical protein
VEPVFAFARGAAILRARWDAGDVFRQVQEQPQLEARVGAGEAVATLLRDLDGDREFLRVLLVHIEDGPPLVASEADVEHVSLRLEAIDQRAERRAAVRGRQEDELDTEPIDDPSLLQRFEVLLCRVGVLGCNEDQRDARVALGKGLGAACDELVPAEFDHFRRSLRNPSASSEPKNGMAPKRPWR